MEGVGGLPFVYPKARTLLPSLEVGHKRASGQSSQALGSLGPAFCPRAFSIDYVLINSSLIWSHQSKTENPASLSTREAGVCSAGCQWWERDSSRPLGR